MVTLLVSNYVWKYSIWGEEEGVGAVTWLGIADLTHIFDAYAAYIAGRVYDLCHLVRDTIYQVDAITLHWTSGSGTRIVWSCTPIKQTFIWLCLMLSTPWANNGWKIATDHKKWSVVAKRIGWILLGMVVIHCFNILRISAITLFIEHHPEWFEMLHTYIFKYLFYGMMFLMWVLYVEKIRD